MDLARKIGILALVALLSIQAGTGIPLPNMPKLPNPGAGGKSKNMPPGVLAMFAIEEAEYCEQRPGDFRKTCSQEFRANLRWRPVRITPAGDTAFLVENRNARACKSTGCALFIFFQQPSREFVQILGTEGEVGSIKKIRVLKGVTNEHYDIEKSWVRGKTREVYRWDGLRYSSR